METRGVTQKALSVLVIGTLGAFFILAPIYADPPTIQKEPLVFIPVSPPLASPEEQYDVQTSPPASASPQPTPSPAQRQKAPAKPQPKLRAQSTSHSITGQATWYAWRTGQAAAGPRLRAALGTNWRGRSVTVCAGSCTRILITDWCACQPDTRLIDLDVRSFAQLANPSRGVVPVTVSW